MDYLGENGHRKIGYLGGYDTADTPSYFSKLFYFEEYIKTHQEMSMEGYLVGNHGVESGHGLMCQWLEEGRALPDAFFVSNDPIAME